MTSALRLGEPAPAFRAATSEGRTWTLADHLGKPVVLYFYPKDETPGCTTQACDVRDNWAAFETVGAEVIGVSPDDAASHQAFRAHHDLPQTLLVDRDHSVMRSYGAWGPKEKNGAVVEGVIRSSVVISADGTVLAVFRPIEPGEQSRLALDALRSGTAR